MSTARGGGRASRFAQAAPSEPLYLPPFKVSALQLSAVSREDRQRLAWERLRKRIHGVVNRANVSNAADCVLELLRLNLVRGLGLLCRSLLRAQVVSQNFSSVYAAMVAAVNARLPELGEVLLARLISQLKRGMDESDRGMCLASVKFIAHLFNQSVVDALLPLEIMHVLAGAPSNDSVELLVAFIKECGALLAETEPRMLDDLFQALRTIVQEGEVHVRLQYLVDGLMSLRRSSFKGFQTMTPALELIPDEDRIIHKASFTGEEVDVQAALDAFAVEQHWEEAELLYAEFRLQVLGEEDDLLFEDAEEEAEAPAGDGVGDGTGGSVVPAPGGRGVEAKPADLTEDDLVTFRRKVYLQIMSAVGYEECAHKLAQFMRPHRGREGELCNMILECCSQERTFMRYYGLVGKQFCLISRVYVSRFEEAFAEHYATVHQFDSRKIRNMANFYAFLLCADALPWSIFGLVVLSEEETTSSSRIFLKYVLLELAQTLTIAGVNERFQDERLRPFLSGLLPSEVPANMRFSINFFTAIGLGPLTDGMRAGLRQIPLQKAATAAADAEGGDAISSSSSSSLSSSSSSDLSHSSSGSRMHEWEAGRERDRERDGGVEGRKRPQSLMRPGGSPPRQAKYARRSFDGDHRAGPSPAARYDARDGRPRHVDVDGERGPGVGRGRGRGDGRFAAGPPLGGGRGRGGGVGRGRDLTVPAWVTEARRQNPPGHSVLPPPLPPPPPPPRADKGQPLNGGGRGRSPSPDRAHGRAVCRSPSPRERGRTPPRYRDRTPPRDRSRPRQRRRSPPGARGRSPDEHGRRRSPDDDGRRRSPDEYGRRRSPSPSRHDGRDDDRALSHRRSHRVARRHDDDDDGDDRRRVSRGHGERSRSRSPHVGDGQDDVYGRATRARDRLGGEGRRSDDRRGEREGDEEWRGDARRRGR
jgi:pre-mRNA-splicing factor CWC22